MSHETLRQSLEIHSPDSSKGLGRLAVRSGLIDAFDQLDGFAPDSKATGKLTAQARYQVAHLDQNRQEIFYDVVAQNEPPEWLRQQIGFPDSDMGDDDTHGERVHDFFDNLTRKETNGRYAIPNRAFVNFLEWHNYVLSQKQEQLDNRAETYKTLFAQRVSDAVKNGWLPASAADQLVQLAPIHLAIDDGFSTTLEPEALAGSYEFARQEVTLEPKIAEGFIGGTPTAFDRQVLFHELFHATANPGKVVRSKQSTDNMAELFGGGHAGKMIQEALTEEMAYRLEYGPDAADSDEADRAMTYRTGRRLLRTLRTKGPTEVPLMAFCDAYFSRDQSSEDGATANEDLRAKLYEAFSPELVKELSALKSDKDIRKFIGEPTPQERLLAVLFGE